MYGGFFGHIFNVKGHGAGFFGIFLVVVFIFVGLIEVVSIGVRPVALTFRLYGNVFAGENILETVMNLGNGVVPYIGGAIAVLPFYVLEILVGLVQALVFALLTSVFTALMCERFSTCFGNYMGTLYAVSGMGCWFLFFFR